MQLMKYEERRPVFGNYLPGYIALLYTFVEIDGESVKNEANSTFRCPVWVGSNIMFCIAFFFLFLLF